MQRGAVLVRGKFILGYGLNRKVVKSKDYEISAIYDAIFSARDQDLSEAVIFSTYFPSLDDMKLLISCGITSVYFFGKIDDPHAVELANKTAQEGLTLQLTQLK